MHQIVSSSITSNYTRHCSPCCLRSTFSYATALNLFVWKCGTPGSVEKCLTWASEQREGTGQERMLKLFQHLRLFLSALDPAVTLELTEQSL